MQNNYCACNHLSFQYCDSSIGLFSIAPCKDIVLNLLCFIFCIISLPLSSISLLYSYCSSNYSDSCRSFSIIKAIAINFSLLFTIAFKIEKCNNVITLCRAIENRTYEPIYNNTKKEAKRLRATTFAITRLEE